MRFILTLPFIWPPPVWEPEDINNILSLLYISSLGCNPICVFKSYGHFSRFCPGAKSSQTFVCLFVLRLNVPVNNFSVMSGRSHRFLDNLPVLSGSKVSCSRTQHGGGRFRTPDLSLRSPTLYHWATALPQSSQTVRWQNQIFDYRAHSESQPSASADFLRVVQYLHLFKFQISC